MSLSTFDPFSLLNISGNSAAAITIQEVIDYAESRLRAMLTNIISKQNNNKIAIDRTTWVGTLLHRELVNLYILQLKSLI
jgi:hypothetical protein